MTAFIDGDLAAADAVGREVSRQWTAHGRSGELTTFVGGLVVQLARERRGIGGLADRIRAMRDAAPEHRGPTSIDAVLAFALYEAGRVDEALTLLIEKRENDFADIPDDAARPVALAMWCEVAARLRDERTAAALRGLLVAQHGLHVITGGWYLGSTARYLALLDVALGHHEEAGRWFAEADEAHLRSPARRGSPW